MNLYEPIIRQFLAPVADELKKTVERGQVERAGFIIRDLQNQYPLFTDTIKSLFAGTPQEVVANCSRYFPGMEKVPGAEAFAEKLQEWLQEQWERPRGARHTQRRLKA